MKVLSVLSVSSLALVAALAPAQLVSTTTDISPLTSSFANDGVLSADEYGIGNTQSVVGNGNTGFGGTLGNGAIYFDQSATDLNIGFQPGGNLDNNVVLFLDTRTGGFTDAQMNDTADGGRRAVSNIFRDSNETYGIQPDFAVVIGSFGIVTFELAAGGDNSLVFNNFDSTYTGANTNFREYTLPLASLGITNGFDYFAAYTSDDTFGSNEALPGQSFLTADNPGYGTAGQDNAFSAYNRFAPVPEPASMAVLGLGLAAFKRRRKNG